MCQAPDPLSTVANVLFARAFGICPYEYDADDDHREDIPFSTQ
jgi:hypothetical protein